MDTFSDVEGIVRRQMVLFFVVDTSGSMAGEKIGTVNNAIREVLPELKNVGGSDVDLKIACLMFSSGCEWMHPAPVPVDVFQWNTAVANGVTDLGTACIELAGKMKEDAFLKAPSASVAPVIFLLSDGEPTDDYKKGIAALKANKWFKYAIRVAVAIGNDANKDVLTEFTGNREAVIEVHGPEALTKWIRKLSITSAQIGSKSQPVSSGDPQSKQDAMIDQIKDVQQSDPDWDTVSTDAGQW